MPEINKPSSRTLFFFMTDNVVHTGLTEPNEVTTSGLVTMISNTNEAQFLADIKPYSRKLPPRPANNADAIEGQVYDDGGVPKIVRRRG